MTRPDDKGERCKGSSMHAELVAAIDRVCRSGAVATITAVAREVGVTPALIHNRYPDVANTIRGLAGRDKQDAMAALKAALVEERRKSSQLRTENAELFAELRTLASVNEGLRRQLAIEQDRSSTRVVALPRRRTISE